MLYFRDHHWLLVQGSSRFNARIHQTTRTREDVQWSLDLNFCAGDPIWRRVWQHERPSLEVSVSNFTPPVGSWRGIENFHHWEINRDGIFGERPGGLLDVRYCPQDLTGAPETTFTNEFIWRVAGRDAGWFTVEFAGVADGRNLIKELGQLAVTVTAEGTEEHTPPDEDFWRKHSEIYFIENVPFGTVTVTVPRNVRDPEAYALARARQLIGVDEPEHVNVMDFYRKDKPMTTTTNDVYVELHFNGFYEE